MNRIFTVKGFITLSFFALIVSMISSCGSSRRSIGIEEGWELLGESKVNFVRDRDEIRVFNRGKFTDIRFKVEDREVRLNDLEVVFDNGDKLEPQVDEVIAPEQLSRVIELARDGRYIDVIRFRYRTTGNILKGRAKVLIFGKRFVDPYTIGQ